MESKQEIDMATKTESDITQIVPLNGRVLMLRDKEREVTKGGIVLPSSSTIPSYSGRILAISEDLKDSDFNIQTYDKIIVDTSIAPCIKVDMEDENKILVPIEAIVGKIQSSK